MIFHLGHAQSILKFNHLTIEQGLSNSRVRSFLQDQYGFIWIGTASGLSRYDGYKFVNYQSSQQNPYSLKHNGIPALLEDSKGHFWIGTKGGLQLMDRNKDVFYPPVDLDNSPFESIGHVIVLQEDKNGHIWVGAVNGLFRIIVEESVATEAAFNEVCQKSKLSIKSYLPWQQKEGNDNWIWSLAEDDFGHLWVGTNRGIAKLNTQTDQFESLSFSNIKDHTSLHSSPIQDIEYTQNGQLWIGSENGLFLLTDSLKNGHQFSLDPSDPNKLHNGFITEIEEDENGYIWIGSDGGGLAKWDPSEEHFIHYKNTLFDNNSLSDNNIEALYIDKKGSLWVGNHRGVSYLNYYRKPFRIIRAGIKSNQLSQGTIESICPSGDGTIWLGVDDGGLNHYDPQIDEFNSYHSSSDTQNNLLDDDVVALVEDQDKRLWIGSWGGGLSWRYRDDRYYHFIEDKLSIPALKDPFIWTLFKDNEDNIWIGTVNNGLVQYQSDTQKFIPHGKGAIKENKIPGTWVISIGQDHQNNIWVYTNAGFYRYQKNRKKIEAFDLAFLNNEDRVSAICTNPDGSMWLGTEKGLIHFHPDRKEHMVINMMDNPSNKWVKNIQKDQNGNLWIGSGRILSKLDPASMQVINYEIKDGFPIGEFTRASAISKDGYIYMGNIEGLVVFQPDSIQPYPIAPKTVITDFLLFNKSVPIAGTNADTSTNPSPLSKAPFIPQQICLKHWQNDVAFEFAALDFLNPEKNKYQYRLKGKQDHWIDANEQIRLASYTNLSPGNYQFQVKAANPDGLWSSSIAKIDLQIAHPWWATWWAYGIYLSIIALVIYLGIYYLKKRIDLQSQLAQKQSEANRLKELDNLKNELYTNITHEFRTPLTVILGMVHRIKDTPEKSLEHGIKLIESNGKNLLRLINQLLDLSKMENNTLRLALIQADIIPYLRYLTASLKTIADNKNIDLHFSTGEPSIVMDYDPEQLKQIIYNLLSNAIKFTPIGGEVNISTQQLNDKLFIQVKDNGIGISAKDINHIFDRFYQVNDGPNRAIEGTGIGLAHTKELVKLLKGEIRAESQLDRGTTMSVTLPITQNAPFAEQNYHEEVLPFSVVPPTKEQHLSDNDLPLILVVEDHPDVVYYITTCLEQKYQIEVAYNGQSGIDLAVEKIPDLIISDVMMPEKDGFIVADTLKNDERTSHIPIVLLTAKADFNSKVKGLKRGADAYLTKPFKEEELIAHIEQLLEKQKRLAKYFSNQQPISVSSFTSNDALDQETIQIEDIFLQKVNGIISQHYQHEDFSLTELCQIMGMSRSQLYRKMKAVVDTAPSTFIRNYRLAEAKKLLETGGFTVSEVAWKVGFKDLAHFSKAFLSAFGISPSDILKP